VPWIVELGCHLDLFSGNTRVYEALTDLLLVTMGESSSCSRLVLLPLFVNLTSTTIFAKCRKAMCSIHWTSAFRYLPWSRKRSNVASVTSASMNGDLLCFTALAERSIPASSHNLDTSSTELVGFSLTTCISPFPQGQYPVPQ
jgi:hypothetical protein